ncbi:MAG: MBL fold metallo-hydrolase [Anaerolineae bacterium]|nr:MBL fold metallo-hydrolase [Anaerolineae bacterium]
MRFTIVYDNYEYDRTLRTAWGFACWIETGTSTVLFDTGGEGATLLGNLSKLDLDPQRIDAIVLSHIHADHTGGLPGLLQVTDRPTVYAPASFPASFKRDVRAHTELVEISDGREIFPGVYTSGQLGTRIVEQALGVETPEGLVVLTGCAHPGIVSMVRAAKDAAGAQTIALVIGGFHLRDHDRSQVEAITRELLELGVQELAACHCTGDRARALFAELLGKRSAMAGLGWAVTIDADASAG